VGRPVALGRVPSLPVVVGVGQVPVARGGVRAGRRRRRLADVGLGQQPRRTAVQHARQVRDVVQITPDEPDQTLSETRVSDKVCWVRSGFAQITLGGPGWTLSLVDRSDGFPGLFADTSEYECCNERKGSEGGHYCRTLLTKSDRLADRLTDHNQSTHTHTHTPRYCYWFAAAAAATRVYIESIFSWGGESCPGV